MCTCLHGVTGRLCMVFNDLEHFVGLEGSRHWVWLRLQVWRHEFPFAIAVKVNRYGRCRYWRPPARLELFTSSISGSSAISSNRYFSEAFCLQMWLIQSAADARQFASPGNGIDP